MSPPYHIDLDANGEPFIACGPPPPSQDDLTTQVHLQPPSNSPPADTGSVEASGASAQDLLANQTCAQWVPNMPLDVQSGARGSTSQTNILGFGIEWEEASFSEQNAPHDDWQYDSAQRPMQPPTMAMQTSTNFNFTNAAFGQLSDMGMHMTPNQEVCNVITGEADQPTRKASEVHDTLTRWTYEDMQSQFAQNAFNAGLNNPATDYDTQHADLNEFNAQQSGLRSQSFNQSAPSLGSHSNPSPFSTMHQTQLGQDYHGNNDPQYQESTVYHPSAKSRSVGQPQQTMYPQPLPQALSVTQPHQRTYFGPPPSSSLSAPQRQEMHHQAPPQGPYLAQSQQIGIGEQQLKTKKSKSSRARSAGKKGPKIKSGQAQRSQQTLDLVVQLQRTPPPPRANRRWVMGLLNQLPRDNAYLPLNQKRLNDTVRPFVDVTVKHWRKVLPNNARGIVTAVKDMLNQYFRGHQLTSKQINTIVSTAKRKLQSNRTIEDLPHEDFIRQQFEINPGITAGKVKTLFDQQRPGHGISKRELDNALRNMKYVPGSGTGGRDFYKEQKRLGGDGKPKKAHRTGQQSPDEDD